MPRNAAYLLKRARLVPFRSCTSNQQQITYQRAMDAGTLLDSMSSMRHPGCEVSAVHICAALGVSGRKPHSNCPSTLSQKSVVLTLRRATTLGSKTPLRPKCPCSRFKHAPHLKHPTSVEPQALLGLPETHVNNAPPFTLFRICLSKTVYALLDFPSYFPATGKENVPKRCTYLWMAEFVSCG